MMSIGFVISRKENERRRALLPQHLREVKNRGQLCFEEGYGHDFGIPDGEYQSLGCHVLPREEAFQCAVICSPKAPEPEERGLFSEGQTLFGWVHAVQNRDIVDFLTERRMTAIAWEEMYDHGRYCFWRNREVAGEAAVLHATMYFGRSPQNCKAAIIGRGNCARGAFRVLSQLGAQITTFGRRTSPFLAAQIGQFDIVVNAVLWDVFRTDHIISRQDLKRMRPGSLIIDISCDAHMAVETSEPTSIADPVYVIDEVIHYAVDHTPSLFYKTATEGISEVIARYVDEIVEQRPGECLRAATVIEQGRITDSRIARFQHRESPSPLGPDGSTKARS